MQSTSSRIWTRVDVSISNDDNHYIAGTSSYMYESFFLLLSYKEIGLSSTGNGN